MRFLCKIIGHCERPAPTLGERVTICHRCSTAFQSIGARLMSHEHAWTYQTTIAGWTVARCECGEVDLA